MQRKNNSLITRTAAAFFVATFAFSGYATAETLRAWVVLTAPTLSARDQTIVREEVDRIWARYDVSLQWHDRAPEIDEWQHLVVTIRVQDGAMVSRPKRGGPILGEVPVVENKMIPRITIAPSAVEEMVAAGISPLNSYPRFAQIYPRFMGRVIAHELGHLLLQMRDHSRTGLMRAQFTFRDTVSDYRHGFHLEPRSVARLDSARPSNSVRVAGLTGAR